MDIYGTVYQCTDTVFGVYYHPVWQPPPEQKLSKEEIYQADRHNALELIRIGGLESATREFGLTPQQLIKRYKLPLPETPKE